MGSESPNVILYDSNGDAMAVSNNTAIPSAGPGTSALLFAGSDGTNAHYILTDSSGRTIVVGAAAAGAAPAGNPNLVAGSVTTAAPTYTTATINYLSLDTSGNLRVTGNFNNASVGATAAAPPADATYVGALVTTAMESGLTSGDMYPFNLTTTGLLRIDGAYPSGTATATAVDMHQVGGLATTAVPTYTTATLNPLSLTLSGQLRIDSAYPTATATGSAPDMTNVGGQVTTAAPAYTTATINALSLTTVGGLRIDSVYPAGTANASAPDVGNTGGYVTTAAPVYTTGQLEPLSIDTAGNLRVTAVTAADLAPATQNITAEDVGSSSSSGANSQQIITGSPTAGSAATFILSTQETIQVQVTGTWTGQLQTEVSLDGGTTWYPREIHQPGTTSLTYIYVSNFAAGLNVGGWTNFRVRAVNTLWTGTATVRVIESLNDNSIIVGNTVSLGVNVPVNNTSFNEITSLNTRVLGSAEGALGVAIMANQYPIWNGVTINSNGSQFVTTNSYGTQQIDLIFNMPSGGTGTLPTITLTMQEVDPGNGISVFGTIVSTGALSGASGGVFTLTLPRTFGCNVKVSWTVGGTTPSFTGVYLTVVSKATPLTQALGSANQPITITLNSLASAAQRQGTVINNTTALFRDALVQLVIKTGATGTVATGIVNIYAYGSSDSGTDYGDTVTGTDGAVTLTSPPNLKLIGTINAVAVATVYKSNPISVAAVFGGILPQFWGIVVENKSGAALDTTAGNFKAFYQGVY